MQNEPEQAYSFKGFLKGGRSTRRTANQPTAWVHNKEVTGCFFLRDLALE